MMAKGIMEKSGFADAVRGADDFMASINEMHGEGGGVYSSELVTGSKHMSHEKQKQAAQQTLEKEFGLAPDDFGEKWSKYSFDKGEREEKRRANKYSLMQLDGPKNSKEKEFASIGDIVGAAEHLNEAIQGLPAKIRTMMAKGIMEKSGFADAVRGADDFMASINEMHGEGGGVYSSELVTG